MIIEAQNLSLSGRLHGVSLTVAPGELVCLIGPNGSGKTSLLHAIAGIGAPTGSVSILGENPWALGPARRPQALTYLPATRDIAWPLAARDLIALGGGTAGLPALELDSLLDRRVDRLSTGERSRILIARALAPRPKLLLLDEPTANLDPLWQLRLMELIRAELATGKRAAIIAIHDLDAAERHADRILVMQDGRIAAEGMAAVPEIFGVEKAAGRWQAVSLAGRRSSP